MPFVFEDEQELLPARIGEIAQDETPMTPSFGQTIGAAWRTDNVVGSYLARENIPEKNYYNPIDQNYDPFADIKGYEDQVRSFALANNADEVATIKRQIDREREDRKTLEESGWVGTVASIASGALDPINLLPVGGAAVTGARTATNLLKGAVSTARAGALSIGLQETLLHDSQEIRTLGESAINLSAGTLLAGALGAGVTALTAKEVKSLTKRLEKDMIVPADDAPDIFEPGSIVVDAPGEGGSVGAAARLSTDPDSEALKNAFGADKAIAFQGPLPRLQQSPSVVSRRIAQGLAETPLVYKKNAEGIATAPGGSVETRVKMHNGKLYQGVVALDNLYSQYRYGRAKSFGDSLKSEILDVTGQSEKAGYLTYKQFKEEVGKAMRRGDEHEIPEVAEAARSIRKSVYEPLKDDAIKLGLLPEDVQPEGAVSYLNRVYSKERIAANRDVFVERVTAYLQRRQSEESQNLIELKKQGDSGALDEARSTELAILEKRDLSKDLVDLKDEASQIADRIMSSPDGRLPYDSVDTPRGGKGGRPDISAKSLKGRSFLISDEEIEDFLESDVEMLARTYTRSMGSDIELVRAYGTVGMDDQIKDVQRDYDIKSNKAKTQKERLAIHKQRDADIRDIAGMRDRIRGVYGRPNNPDSWWVRAGRVGRVWNYTRLLGSTAVASIPDIGRAVMVHGFGSVLKDGLVPLITNLKAVKLSTEELKLAGTALDMVLDSRAMAIADVMDDFGRNTKLERGQQKLASAFGKISLISPWTAGMKQFTGMISLANMVKATKAVAEARGTKEQFERLASSGIDPYMARRISDQIDKFGEDVDGMILPQTEKWTDKEAVHSVRQFLSREVDKAIISPGQEKPLWMSTEMGKFIGQFRSFTISSAQRVMLAGLQDRNMKALSGATTMLGLGMLTEYIYSKMNGQDMGDNPASWIKAGVDRSGLLGWIMDVNNISEKLTGGSIGLSRLAGGKQSSRYTNINAVGALLGPSFGLAKDISDLAYSGANGEWSKRDTRALRRLAPMQNIFWLRNMFDKAEEGINAELGVH